MQGRQFEMPSVRLKTDVHGTGKGAGTCMLSSGWFVTASYTGHT
jgi:hypothetical protein